MLGEAVLALCKDVAGESIVKKLSDCISFSSCISFGISDHCIDSVGVILLLSVMSSKIESLGISVILLEICSGFDVVA